jgi:redox-sensitive bicupin YhaK (pirin superfamily)
MRAMSNLDPASSPASSADCDPASTTPVAQRITARITELGEGMKIRRALPARERRLIGAWCFLDHFGPTDIAGTRGMRVGPHPHIGLQTVTWLLEGEVLHRDSLGSLQSIQPGELNLMTSGRGISHSEESPPAARPLLHGLQFWIALPDSAMNMDPAFDHYPVLPEVARDGASITVLVGEALGERSPAAVHSPLVGLDVRMAPGSSVMLPLRASFEHGALVMQGSVSVADEELVPGSLLYLGCGRESIALRSQSGGRAVLVGGLPFAEPVLMWWNFVARTQQQILRACREWNAGADTFGEVRGYDGDRLTAPLPPWPEAGGGPA